MITLRTKIFFIFLFILLSSFIYLALAYEKKEKIEQYLQQKTTLYNQKYNATYEQYKKLSKVIFDLKINSEEVINILAKIDGSNKDAPREELYNSLSQTYEMLKTHNLKQLHFHLPNNESFLRFHRPNVFGDDLSQIRQTVSYTNRYKKYIDGFEEGRIYNGYRFVYPLFDRKKYLGSVEISFSTHAMSETMTQKYDLKSYFLIRKDVVDQKLFESEKHNYSNSNLGDFYIENNINNYLNRLSNTNILDYISPRLEKQILHHFESPKNAFSLYNKDDKHLLTFIKVKNAITQENIGLFVIASDANYISNKTNNFYTALLVSNLLLLSVLLFIYFELLNRFKQKALQNKVEQINQKLIECIEGNKD